jgi:membrane protease subunit HflK
MAWNQPGGQNNSPWGRRPGQGGPDLDERVKGWQRRLDQLLRPGGEGGKLALVIVAIVVALWFGSGVFQIKAAERGVILRFGKFVALEPPGLGVRWPWPIESLTKVNVASINSSDFKSRVLTSDVNLVDVRFSVQYQFADPFKALFKLREPETTLSEVSESAIREIVGRSTLDDVIVGVTRPQITKRTKDLIQKTLDYYDSGITVTTVNLTDVQVPDTVIPAQRDTNKAIADKERTINEAQAYANSILPAAQGAAAQMQQNAQGYKSRVTALADGQTARVSQLEEAYAKAPEVTRRRLYMDTVEGVLSRSHKVLLDSKATGSGGGNMFYLPLDKLLEKSASQGSDQTSESTATTLPKEPDSVTVEARGRGER